MTHTSEVGRATDAVATPSSGCGFIVAWWLCQESVASVLNSGSFSHDLSPGKMSPGAYMLGNEMEVVLLALPILRVA